MKEVMAYANFFDLWAKAAPETPLGRDAHEAPKFFFDIDQLEAIYDQTDTLLSLLRELQNEPARLALITHHLKRLPRLPDSGQRVFDEIELFQVKKFLRNYRALMDQLPIKVRRGFGFDYRSQSLEDRLSQGRQDAETFYIADDYSAELANVRAEILETDARIQALETKIINEIKELYGFDFQGRLFLLIPKESLRDFDSASHLLAIEPYDDNMYSARPLKCAAALALAERRQKLARQERICEEAVLETIAKDVHAELPKLSEYNNTTLTFDLAWARARMAAELGLTRPRLNKENPIRVTKGRFAPCESICAEHGVKYNPLDAVFESGTAVIFGSNMGGKTVVLQTTALLQLAAQAGLFVPADVFETRVFRAFHYIGERRSSLIHQGLSGFGMEMRQFINAWQSVRTDTEGTLVLMDEFASTTSSSEAEAILAAILEAVSQKTNTCLICSTHFHRLPRLPNIRFLRMAGLELKHLPTEPNADPISEIARHMTYRLIADDGKQSSDAIAIAQMLGLDKNLVQRAELFFRQ
jgi:dsDNA-specific endonuclease/ATPase MutS2